MQRDKVKECLETACHILITAILRYNNNKCMLKKKQALQKPVSTVSSSLTGLDKPKI